MLKRVDNAVFKAFDDVRTDSWTAGFDVLGLAEDGVGWALDDNNKSLVSDDMKAALDEASQKIISGEIQVHDYMSDDTCPVS